MKRFAAGLVFAAVLLAPAVPFALESQPAPCDAACKHESCLSKCTQFAQMACHGATRGNQNRCIHRAKGKCVEQCMRGLGG
jgi:hypothetical protein